MPPRTAHLLAMPRAPLASQHRVPWPAQTRPGHPLFDMRQCPSPPCRKAIWLQRKESLTHCRWLHLLPTPTFRKHMSWRLQKYSRPLRSNLLVSYWQWHQLGRRDFQRKARSNTSESGYQALSNTWGCHRYSFVQLAAHAPLSGWRAVCSILFVSSQNVQGYERLEDALIFWLVDIALRS